MDETGEERAGLRRLGAALEAHALAFGLNALALASGELAPLDDWLLEAPDEDEPGRP